MNLLTNNSKRKIETLQKNIEEKNFEISNLRAEHKTELEKLKKASFVEGYRKAELEGKKNEAKGTCSLSLGSRDRGRSF